MTRHLDQREIELFDELEGAARDRAVEHARSCDSCRSELAARDPSRLFGLLPAPAIPAEILDQVSERVAVEIRGRRAPLKVWTAGAWAAALVLAGLLGVYLGRPPISPGGSRPVEPQVPPVLLSSDAPRAAVELLSSDDTAQVFDVTVGETQLVMIFDEGIEL